MGQKEERQSKINLFEHNRIAYEAALSLLAETGKVAIVHPTGTGKFFGFKLCEDHPEQRICWLSPSSYIFETQLEGLKAAADGYAPDNVLFYTYAKLMLLSGEEISNIRPDYIILDEFHRCGAPASGEAVQSLLKAYPNTPILGLSATNLRYLDAQRDMAVELFDGNIASEMTLGEAVVRGILTPPKYVLSVFAYHKDLEKHQNRARKAKSQAVRDRAEEYLEALRRSLENADGLDEIFHKHMPDPVGKYIVFCSNMEHMQRMLEKVPEWFSKVDEAPYVYSVYSEDPMADKAFQDFKSNQDPRHLKLLYCIDALNEGIHMKDISGVILLRPTVSPIIYKQQIGRTMSAHASHQVVIFDVVMNIHNLYSISSLQQEMKDAVSDYIQWGEGERIVNEQFTVIDEVRACRALFDQLNDTLSASWELMFKYARAYFEDHGDLNVPKRYKTPEGYSLGAWLATQRKVYQGQVPGILTENQKCRRDSIGMRWRNIQDVHWDTYYTAARRYYEDHGDLVVTSRYVTEDGLPLGRWLSRIRRANLLSNRDCSGLSPEQKELLDSIGMIWNKSEYLWAEKFAAAREYYEEHHNLNMPHSYITPDGLKLGMWITRVRDVYNGKIEGRLTPEQVRRLETIGMDWRGKYDYLWEAIYDEAESYFREHGNLNVPAKLISSNGIRLGSWVSRQREAFAKGKLDSEKISLLNKIGMVWEKPNSWQARYSIASRYSQEHGDINISQNVVIDGIWIGKWLAEQRKKKEQLPQEQVQLLDAIGMRWEKGSGSSSKKGRKRERND